MIYLYNKIKTNGKSVNRTDSVYTFELLNYKNLLKITDDYYNKI